MVIAAGFYWLRSAVDVAAAAVRFEVRLAEESPAPGLREVVIPGTGRSIFLHEEAVVTNSDIIRAWVVQGDSRSTFSVSVEFNAEGTAKMLRATKGHIGRPVAILIDDEVVTVPVVRSPVSTSAIIGGKYTSAEAERIVAGIVGR
jgi:preprotein translocase subunit SecD